jgi:hypothetical protein
MDTLLFLQHQFIHYYFLNRLQSFYNSCPINNDKSNDGNDLDLEIIIRAFVAKKNV